ncbi:hypothetical protein GC173_14030 [bacterium]|nr:hypothetical protein [bacterium]
MFADPGLPRYRSVSLGWDPVALQATARRAQTDDEYSHSSITLIAPILNLPNCTMITAGVDRGY